MGALPASPTKTARRSSSRGASWSATCTWLRASVASSAVVITCTAGVPAATWSRRRRTTLSASARLFTRALTHTRLPEHTAHLASQRRQVWAPRRLQVSESPSLRLRWPQSPSLLVRRLQVSESPSLRLWPPVRGARPCIAVTPPIIRTSSPYLAWRGARPCIAVTPHTIRSSAPYVRLRRVLDHYAAHCPVAPELSRLEHSSPAAPPVPPAPRTTSPSLRPLLLFGRTTTRT